MKRKNTPTLIALPSELKRQLREFCKSHGLKMNFLVTLALKKFLAELKEDEQDIILANERMLGEFESEESYLKYIKSRGINV